MLKKIMLLGAAIAALVAIAAPAAQASHVFATNNVPITEHENVVFSGEAAFELTSGAAGAHAEVEATMTLNAGTLTVGGQVGTVKEFHVFNCTGTGQLNNRPCTPTTTEVNWPVTLRADTNLEIDVNLHQIYYGDAGHTIPVATTSLVGPVVVDINAAAITSGTLTGGEGLLANGGPATASGTLFTETEGLSLE
ncbi:MAG: hypothetical protein QOE75_2456 [Solirubrobacterales bacterium]|nr:hypothetical protein [Solirubrobacterales bacterium]